MKYLKKKKLLEEVDVFIYVFCSKQKKKRKTQRICLILFYLVLKNTMNTNLKSGKNSIFLKMVKK